MTQSANDTTMTIDFSWRGVLLTPHPVCVLSWAGWRKYQWGSEAKPRLGVWTGDESPEAQAFLL